MNLESCNFSYLKEVLFYGPSQDTRPPGSILCFLVFSFLFHFCIFSPIFSIFLKTIFSSFSTQIFYPIQCPACRNTMGNVSLRVRGQVSMSLACILNVYQKASYYTLFLNLPDIHLVSFISFCAHTKHTTKFS